MTFRERVLLAWGRRHIGEVIRRRALRRALRTYVRPGGRILDAGCGRGDNAIGCARRYPACSVDAIDVDPALTALVVHRAQACVSPNLTVRCADLVAYAHPEGARYATMYSVDVFEHLADPAVALRNLAVQLSGGGAIILHVPRARQRRWCGRFERYAQDDHERDGFEPEEVRALIDGAGLAVVEVRHTFGPPGALAWELFHLSQAVGKWLVLLTYPVTWSLAWIDGCIRWRRGNGMLIVGHKSTSARALKPQGSRALGP